MRRCSMAGAALILTLAGCSSDDPAAPPPPPPSGGLGTPLTAAGAIEAQAPLLWSFATDEIVAVASFNDPNSNSLIALASTNGTRRQLEPLASTPLALTPDGAGVYYATLELDSTVARSAPLSPVGTRKRLNSCGSGCFHVVLPVPLSVFLVAIYPVGDSTALMNVSSGQRQMLTSGYPLAFSPDGTQLLKKELFEPLQDALIFDLGTGQTLPANLGLPDEIGDYLVRWTVTGIEVLYQTPDRQSLVLRRAGLGQDATVYTTPDTLEAAMDWVGERIAVWTSKTAGTGRRYQLTVIEGDTGLLIVDVASTTLLPGRPKLPPDGSDAIVYAVDRRLYRSTFTPPVEGLAR